MVDVLERSSLDLVRGISWHALPFYSLKSLKSAYIVLVNNYLLLSSFRFAYIAHKQSSHLKASARVQELLQKKLLCCFLFALAYYLQGFSFFWLMCFCHKSVIYPVIVQPQFSRLNHCKYITESPNIFQSGCPMLENCYVSHVRILGGVFPLGKLYILHTHFLSPRALCIILQLQEFISVLHSSQNKSVS